jgi:hypothetical protein
MTIEKIKVGKGNIRFVVKLMIYGNLSTPPQTAWTNFQLLFKFTTCQIFVHIEYSIRK